MTVESYADLAAAILERPPRLGVVRLVVVDGPSGAGKTTFATRLVRAIPGAGIVHTDELLDGWADQFTFWSRLEKTVLDPLARGEPGRHPVYDWDLARFGTEREIPVPAVLVVEGGTSARPEAYPRVSFSVFVDADRDTRWQRVLARDGPEIAVPLRRWMAAEEEFFATNGTRGRADRVVDGVATVGHDPESGYVRLR